MDATDVAGWLLVTGSVAFGVGAGNPYLIRGWTAPQETFLAIVARHPLAWRVTHYLFIGGTVATAAGLAGLPGVVTDGWPRGLAIAGAAAFAIAAVLWIVALLYRLAVVPGTARAHAEAGRIEPWIADFDRLSGALFTAFIVTGFAGLAAIGIATTAGGPIPAVIGWGTAVLAGLLVAGLLVSGDMPPFTIYIAPLAFGVALLVST